MSRFLWRLIFVLGFAAVCAAGIVLWLSPDPLYHAQEFIGHSRFRAYDDLIRAAAARHGVDPVLIKAIVWRESGFHPEKVGTSGERGLMQVMEAAATDWVRAEKIETFVPTDLFDASTNLEVGVWYFAKAMERWKAKDAPEAFALAEYNAGRSRVDRWVAASNMGEKATAEDLLSAMDFPGTRRYIEAILARRRFYEERGWM